MYFDEYFNFTLFVPLFDYIINNISSCRTELMRFYYTVQYPIIKSFIVQIPRYLISFRLCAYNTGETSLRAVFRTTWDKSASSLSLSL
jgi:hypothetical protein